MLAELIDTVRRLERGLDKLTWAALTLGVQPASMQPAEQESDSVSCRFVFEQLHTSEPRESLAEGGTVHKKRFCSSSADPIEGAA